MSRVRRKAVRSSRGDATATNSSNPSGECSTSGLPAVSVTATTSRVPRMVAPRAARSSTPRAPSAEVSKRLLTDDPNREAMDKASVARFLLLALLWGSSFTFIKVSLEGLTPGQLVLSRLVLGAAVLLTIAAIRKITLPRSVPVWDHIAAAGLFGNVIPFLLLSYGEKTTGAGIAGVLIGASPLLTLRLAAAALPTERATSRKAVGLALGFIGVVLLIGPWHESLGSLSGRLACFGAAVSYAIGFVYVRKYLSPLGLAPLSLAAAQLVSAAVL